MRKSHLTFLVKYQGKMIDESKRLTYAELRDTEALHNYLTKNNLRKYINKRFTYERGSPECLAEQEANKDLKRSVDSQITKQAKKRSRKKR
jgi:hypothetical protein